MPGTGDQAGREKPGLASADAVVLVGEGDAGGRFRGVYSSASGCDLAGAVIFPACRIKGQWLDEYPYGASVREQRVRQVAQSPLGISLRISLRIQITPRCALSERIGQLTSG